MDTGAVILTTFLSTIPVYLFFATGFYLRHKQVIQADHDAPIMRIAMDVAYPCLVFHSIMKYMVLSGNETLSSVSFSLQAIAAGALELLLGIAAAWLVAKMLRMRIGTGLRTFTLTAGVQNYAFFVIPIIQMLFAAGNDPTLGVLFVHNVVAVANRRCFRHVVRLQGANRPLNRVRLEHRRHHHRGRPGQSEYGRFLPRPPAGRYRGPSSCLVRFGNLCSPTAPDEDS